MGGGGGGGMLKKNCRFGENGTYIEKLFIMKSSITG
jgi:hypothetical protein